MSEWNRKMHRPGAQAMAPSEGGDEQKDEVKNPKKGVVARLHRKAWGPKRDFSLSPVIAKPEGTS